MVADTGDSSELAGLGFLPGAARSPTTWTALGNPTWYARFAAQVMTDPAYHNIVVQ